MTYTVYCLINASRRRTYVGSTNHLERRLRQHNGELVGGAKYTSSKGPWVLLGQFLGDLDRSTALRLEFWCKGKCRLSGLPKEAKGGNAVKRRIARLRWIEEEWNRRNPEIRVSWVMQ